MASSKIKMKLSLKELTIEFEGDRETAEKIGVSITKTLDGLKSAPEAVIGDGPAQLPLAALDVTATERRRKKRSSSSRGSGDADGSARNGSIPDAVTRLRDDGYFDEPRRVKDLIGKFGELGHSYKVGDLSPVLIRLTRTNVLARAKNKQTNQWEYTRPVS